MADSVLLTLTALCFIAAMMGAEMQLLPSCYGAMRASLDINYSWYPFLMMCQGIPASTMGPVWSVAMDYGYSRRSLITAGAVGWGVSMLCLSFASSLYMMAVLRIINGTFVAMTVPTFQSLVGDLSKRESRGLLFGMIALSMDAGQVFTSSWATALSGRVVLRVAGWRVAHAAIGVLSLCVALAVPFTVADNAWAARRPSLSAELAKISGFFSLGTFRCIVCQGLFGTVAHMAIGTWCVLFFQHRGYSDVQAGTTMAAYTLGSSAGSLLGGMIGDRMAAWSPAHGRVLTAQLSIALSIPLLFEVFYTYHQAFPVTLTMCAMLGLVNSWVVPGCIKPIMCDIVPREDLAKAFSWELAIVFLSGKVGGPLVVSGIAVQFFGFQTEHTDVKDMPIAVREQNANALGQAIICTTVVPSICCLLIFCVAHFTYAHDRDAAAATCKADGDFNMEVAPEGHLERKTLANESTALLPRAAAPGPERNACGA